MKNYRIIIKILFKKNKNICGLGKGPIPITIPIYIYFL